MATIVSRGVADYDVEAIYLCGGACMLGGIGEVFETVCGVRAYVPENPILITPIGIALNNV
jgi:ethanolamine utilization protein EutJ